MQIMLSLNNPTIAKIIGYDKDKDSITIIMPFYKNSSLDSIITELMKKKRLKKLPKLHSKLFLLVLHEE